MKKFIYIFILFSVSIFGQFKSDLDKNVDIKSGILSGNPSPSLLGFFNPENFFMNHSVGMSFTSGGGYGYALGVYTNSMMYQFSENINIQADVSLVNSPYSSLGNDFSKHINGIYITKAALNYKISDNTNLSIQYRQLPAGYGYGGYYNGFYNNSFWNNSFWSNDAFMER